LYLPAATRYKRLELFDVDLGLATLFLVLAASRLDPRMVQTLFDCGPFSFLQNE
jgi:hypothetical protein